MSKMTQEKTTCRFCGSANIIKWCRRETLNRGFIQRYKCKDCGKYFAVDDGFFRMRNAPQKITCALDLFYRGVSVRKVQEHFQAFYPHNSSWVSIYKWVIKYSKKISKFTERLKVVSSGEVEFDEMEYHRRKSKSGGVDKNWFIDCIDTQTRFMAASDYCKSRGARELKQVMSALRDKTESQMKILTTDGLFAYSKVIKKVFGYDSKAGKFNVLHNRVNASAGEGFNYKVERMHSNIRARTKTMRGFHGSISSANAIMKGYEIYYNFIRKHMAINCCPYELAIPELKDKLNVPNKWLALISEAQDIKR